MAAIDVYCSAVAEHEPSRIVLVFNECAKMIIHNPELYICRVQCSAFLQGAGDIKIGTAGTKLRIYNRGEETRFRQYARGDAELECRARAPILQGRLAVEKILNYLTWLNRQ